MHSLRGKTALINGSGRGLGNIIAQRLATQRANIVLHDKSWDAPQQFKEAQNLDEVIKRFEKFGIQTFAATGNIGDVQAVAAMRDQIIEKFDGIDILVNCAGGDIGAKGGKPSPNNALDIPIEDVQALVKNNLIGTINVCRAFIPPMRDR